MHVCIIGKMLGTELDLKLITFWYLSYTFCLQ